MKKRKTKESRVLSIAVVICAAAVVAMVIALCVPKVERGEFQPPPFDVNAQIGTPTVDERLGYSKLSHDQLSFTAWLCGGVTVKDEAARLYFTSPEDNTVWLKVRLFNAKGDVIGESGIIRPGEYVEYVQLTKRLSVGDAIAIKVMAYEAETWRSEGAVTLNAKVIG